jgi:TatD DNase family protein
MNLIDSHCHLYYEPFVLDLQKNINECKINNVNLLLSIGVDYETSKKNIEISEEFDEVYCTIGLHPNNVKTKINELNKIFSLLKESKKIIGIGECGLDLYRSKDNLNQQIECFEKQIQFSLDNKLPFIIHTRDSDKEIISVLNNFKNKKMNFILHCFSGNLNFAREYIDLGGYISFSGILTFKNSKELQQTCKDLPLDKILIETDSPYLSPHPIRGKPNHPKNVNLIAQKISDIKNIEFNKVAHVTSNNFKKLFDI